MKNSMKIIITIEVDGENVNVSTETKESEGVIIGAMDDYTKVFDDSCIEWSKDSIQNSMFLKCQQNYANDVLRARGHLFLNEVFDMLGIPRTKAGAIVGWIYDEENPLGDNFVDFGLLDDCNVPFVNGKTNNAILNFNVDGNILDKI